MALSLLSKKPIFTIAVGTTAALLTGTTLYAFELNNLVNDAQSQIQSLSKQISSQESSERKKLAKLTDYQVNTNETLNKLTDEISKARTDLEMAYLKKEGAIRDVLEEDFRRTLKILTAAHSDHLNDKLKQQYNSLNEEFQNVLDEQIRLHKNKYCEELKASVFKLYELEKTLKTRKDLDEQELKSRQLWVLCQSIKDVLRNPFGSVPSVEINKQVENFSKIAKSLKDDSLLQNVLSSMIKTTKENTIYSEDTLIARFKNVDKLCRRVALVKEDNASITKYFLSYIQSMLVIDNFKIDPDEVNGIKVVDVNRFNTFSILARMKYCLDNKKFEECLKYANLLKGAPKRIAHEWIKDLTTHLEVRQAADILEAQTASYTIRSIN